MKKFMRIALVFALAGATLMYTGCTKDYSGDISDLNKKVSEQATALSALQTQVGAAQTAADKAVSDAAAALAEAKKKATPAEVAAVEQKIDALIAGDVKDLKDWKASAQTELERIAADYVTKVQFAQDLADLKAELEQAIAAGDKVNADAIAELEKKVNKLLADAITIAAPAGQVTVNYDYATFNLPSGDALKAEPYKSLVAAFPEVEAFRGNEITQGGHVPFTVNPESTEFDDTFTYEFVGLDGKTFGTLTEPVEGFVGIDTENTTQSSIVTKAANGFWTLSFAPTFKKAQNWPNPLVVADDDVENLSLVVTKGETRAATAFAYEATGIKINENATVTYAHFKTVNYAETIDLLNAKYYDKDAGKEITGKIVKFHNILDGKFIFSGNVTEDKAENDLLLEEYGVEFGAPGESAIKVTKYPENVSAISFKINVMCLGLNGSATRENFDLIVAKAIDADGVLAAQEITLKDDNRPISYKVRWNLADYGFTKAQTKEFVEAANHKLSFTFVNPYTGKTVSAPTVDIDFYDATGTSGATWDKAVKFGFNLDPSIYGPDTYAVTFRVYNGNVEDLTDVTVYAAKSTITVKNAEDYKVYLLKELCDEDGVLQAVGTPNGDHIEYNIENAFVNEYTNVDYYGFEDAEFNPYAAGGKVANYDWADDEWTLVIPINGTLEDPSKPTSPKFDYVNKTVRNVVAYFVYFGNKGADNHPDNIVGYPFQVKVVSPIAGGIVPQDQEIFFNDEPNSFYVRAAVDSAEYVAGWKSGIEYDVISYSTGGTILNRRYYYDLDEGIKSVAIAFNKPAEAAKFIEPNVAVESNATLEKQYTWTIPTEGGYNGHDADATKFEIKAKQNYSEQTDLPAGYVVLPATVTVTDKWGIVEKLQFNVKVSIKK